MQRGGILVSRIFDISRRKSGHFQIVAANLSIFGIKRFKHSLYLTQFNSKWKSMDENKHLLNFICHTSAKFCKYKIQTFFSWKSGYGTKNVFLQLYFTSPCLGRGYKKLMKIPIRGASFSTTKMGYRSSKFVCFAIFPLSRGFGVGEQTHHEKFDLKLCSVHFKCWMHFPCKVHFHCWVHL